MLAVVLTCAVAGTVLVVLGQILFGVNGAAISDTLRFVAIFTALIISSLVNPRAVRPLRNWSCNSSVVRNGLSIGSREATKTDRVSSPSVT